MSTDALYCKDLYKRFSDVIAVDGLSLSIARGECFGLLGPNGAGKTTTVEMFEGLTQPDSGELKVLGESWRGGRSDRALRERLGVQLQETQMQNRLSTFETVRLFRSFYESGRTIDEVIELVGLQEKRHARVGKLSGGQRQRLALACAMVGDPEILFLDEPTTGLDPQARRRIWDIVSQYQAGGGTVLLTTHYMEEAEALCDRVGIVEHGKLVALDSPAALVASLKGEQIVELSLDRDLPPEALAALDGVADVRKDADIYRLAIQDIGKTLPAVLVELKTRELDICTLTTHEATLEDVFFVLTGRALRDE